MLKIIGVIHSHKVQQPEITKKKKRKHTFTNAQFKCMTIIHFMLLVTYIVSLKFHAHTDRQTDIHTHYILKMPI